MGGGFENDRMLANTSAGKQTIVKLVRSPAQSILGSATFSQNNTDMTVFYAPDSSSIELDLEGGESVYHIKRRLYEETGQWYNLVLDPAEGLVAGESPEDHLYARVRLRDEVFLVPAQGPGGACPPGLDHPSLEKKEILPGIPAATLDAILAIVERRVVRLEQGNNELINEANLENADVWAANQVAMDAETRLATLGFAQVLATRQPIAVPGADCVDGRPIEFLAWKHSDLRARRAIWMPILEPFIELGTEERRKGKKWSDFIYQIRRTIGGCVD